MRQIHSHAPSGASPEVAFKLFLYEMYNRALLRLLVKHGGNVVGCDDSPAVSLAITRITDLRPGIPEPMRVEAMQTLVLADGWPLNLPSSCGTVFFDLN